VIIVSASGGARMYEGMLSLMQMAKTSGALARHACERLPYISVLTNPTTAGVMASFASLGDVIIAEPKSMIGFAGPRVIKETTHQDLPERFQTAEFLEEHGLIDLIVHRKKMRSQVSDFLTYFSNTQ
jgi:acetyl-CoA carboxylase carboxyl transferase subunit beta